MSDTPTPRTDTVCDRFSRGLMGSGEVRAFMEQLERELAEANGENTRLRAALANSAGACVYCQLPKEQWAACRSGFPGCARDDDAMGCPELGAAMELHAARERIRRLVEAGDAMAQQFMHPTVDTHNWTQAKEARP
jgi:hypothetical protein